MQDGGGWRPPLHPCPGTGGPLPIEARFSLPYFAGGGFSQTASGTPPLIEGWLIPMIQWGRWQ